MANFITKSSLPLLFLWMAFFSYHDNFFRSASDRLFLVHDFGSETLVLDSIVHKENTGQYSKLGSYASDDLSEQASEKIENSIFLFKQQYTKKNRSGDFQQYHSQFGLQGYFFQWVSEKWNRDIRYLQSIPAMLMSLVVVLFYVVIRREFSCRHAIYFCTPLIFSPWIVVFAKSLYWVEAFWFLPTIITFFLGKSSFGSKKNALIMQVLLFFAFLIKCLCGYEYISTIALSACVPLIYYGIKNRYGFKLRLLQIFSTFVSIVLAFSLAIVVHVYLYDGNSTLPLNDITVNALRHLSVQENTTAIKKICDKGLLADQKKCEDSLLAVYNKSRLNIAIKYFIFPHFFPWIDQSTWSSADEVLLKSTKNNMTVTSIKYALTHIHFKSWLFLLSYLVSIIGFLVFQFYVWRIALTERNQAFTAGLFVSTLAPLSWYLLVKTHSYAHYHLNYVLWYLIYIPFGMLLIADHKLMPLLRRS